MAEPNIIQAGNLQVDLSQVEQAVGGHLGHVLVESMANPGIVAESAQGRDNYTQQGTAAAKRRFDNQQDAHKLQTALGDMGYSTTEEEVAEVNRQLGNTILIDVNAGKGGGW